MKKLIVLITCLIMCVVVKAQWSVGFDARIAPWGDDQKNMGTDIVLNYNFGLKNNFFLMPSVGFFYQRYTTKDDVIYYYSYVDGRGSGSQDKYDYGSRSGVDFTLVIGKSFNLGAGSIALFTGPRYGYAYATKQIEVIRSDYLRNTLDWRIGASYSIWKITASVKCDIGLLRYLKNHHVADYKDHQIPVLGIGISYNL